MCKIVSLGLFVLLGLPLAASASPVVVNEILYHAPDDLDEVQFVELHNPGDRVVDLSGWKLLARDASHRFPPRSRIEPGGFLVLCKDAKAFRTHFGFDAHASFVGSLGRARDQVELLDATGKRIDRVKYRDRDPWPIAPDGHGSSLERICPTLPAEGPENWTPSPLPVGTPKPGGTPGKKNAGFAPRLPPVITGVTLGTTNVRPDQPVRIEADVRSAAEPCVVEARYRVVGPGFEKDEQVVRMTRGTGGRYAASIPGQKTNQIVRVRIRAVDARKGERTFPCANEIRPALSYLVSERFEPGKIPLGMIVNVGAAEFKAAARQGPPGPRFGAPPATRLPARGNSAFVYVGRTGRVQLFDFVHVTPRTGGRKVRFHKDQPLDDMTTINLVYEYVDRFVLAEPLAFEVHRKAGNAAPRTDFVRTWIDGRAIGYQLLIEQPNKAFLRRNQVRADGNLYKAQWTGRTVTARHEKKTNVHAGHDDLVKVVEALNRAKGDEQWEVIRKHFDVDQVVDHYAARMVLSDWDGFFNNYYAYHDVKGSGKWTMYPWDQDKTWGYHDGIRGYEVFFDMPITFGMQGDRPPGSRFGGFGFGFGGPVWWRSGGDFARPLLANPRFRKQFVARTKELLEKVYTEKAMFPLIRELGERLEEEVKVRADLYRQDSGRAVEHLRRNLESLREHVTKRRKYLLAQDEVKKAGTLERR